MCHQRTQTCPVQVLPGQWRGLQMVATPIKHPTNCAAACCDTPAGSATDSRCQPLPAAGVIAAACGNCHLLGAVPEISTLAAKACCCHQAPRNLSWKPSADTLQVLVLPKKL